MTVSLITNLFAQVPILVLLITDSSCDFTSAISFALFVSWILKSLEKKQLTLLCINLPCFDKQMDLQGRENTGVGEIAQYQILQWSLSHLNMLFVTTLWLHLPPEPTKQNLRLPHESHTLWRAQEWAQRKRTPSSQLSGSFNKRKQPSTGILPLQLRFSSVQKPLFVCFFFIENC